MFVLLTQILLWLLIGIVLYYLFLRLIPKVYFTWLGGALVFAFIILSFLNPTARVVSLAWAVLSFPLRPLGLSILLLAVSLRSGLAKVNGNLVAATLAILLVFSLPITAYWLTVQSQQSVFETISRLGDPVPDPNTVRAIVILGDGITPSDPVYQTRQRFGSTEDGFGAILTSRLLYGAQLYRDQVGQGNNPLVIVSAGPQPEIRQDDIPEADAVRDFLINNGVSSDRILIDSRGVSARTSGVQVLRLLSERGFAPTAETVVVVAPAVSIRRILSTFADLGVRAIPRPTDVFAFQMTDGGEAALSSLIPNVEALTVSSRVIEEYLTSIYYFLRGWLSETCCVTF